MFDPGALMARHYVLPEGTRVCLRLARVRDQEGIRALAEGRGTALDDLEAARLSHVDPRHRLVLCATALVDAVETIVGFGAIELHEDADGEATEPTLLVVDEHAEGLHELLHGALVGRARALADAVRPAA